MLVAVTRKVYLPPSSLCRQRHLKNIRLSWSHRNLRPRVQTQQRSCFRQGWRWLRLRNSASWIMKIRRSSDSDKNRWFFLLRWGITKTSAKISHLCMLSQRWNPPSGSRTFKQDIIKEQRSKRSIFTEVRSLQEAGSRLLTSKKSQKKIRSRWTFPWTIRQRGTSRLAVVLAETQKEFNEEDSSGKRRSPEQASCRRAPESNCRTDNIEQKMWSLTRSLRNVLSKDSKGFSDVLDWPHSPLRTSPTPKLCSHSGVFSKCIPHTKR